MRALSSARLVALAVSLAACGGDTGTGPSLAGALLDQTLTGYAVQSNASGPLTADNLAGATPVDPAALRGELDKLSLRGAYERTWSDGSDFVTDIVVEMGSQADAATLVDFESQAIASTGTTTTYSIAAAPGARAFILDSTTRAGGHDVFCRGAWFSMAARAFEVISCGTTPAPAQYADGLVGEQYQRASTPVSPSPPSS